jgi:hypothetical protein
MSQKQEWIRHGDVALVRAAPLGRPLTQGRSLTLAEGEVTGHAHVLVGDLEFDQVAEPTFVVVRGTAVLTHPEHATLEIPAGAYRVVRQREHWGGVQRTVLD